MGGRDRKREVLCVLEGVVYGCPNDPSALIILHFLLCLSIGKRTLAPLAPCDVYLYQEGKVI